jgi:hypothetical protein
VNLYRPDHLWQGDPHDDDPHGWVDCGSFSMAMLTDAISHGTVRPTGHQYRSLVKSEPEPDPADPGVTNTQLLEAARRFGLRVTNEVRPWANLERAVAAFRGATVSTWYPELGPYRAQKTGEFGHSIFLMARSSDGRKFLMFDPLAKTPRWVPVTVLREAAMEWGRRTGVSGKVRYLVTIDAIPYE